MPLCVHKKVGHNNLYNRDLNTIQNDFEKLKDRLFCTLKSQQILMSFCKTSGLGVIKQMSSAYIT